VRITDKNANYIVANLYDYKPSVTLSYSLVRVTSLRYVSLDRGEASDKYETEITITGDQSKIDSIMTLLLNAQRKATGSATYLTLSDFYDNKGEAIFGDNVVYTTPINAIVIETPMKKNISFNLYSITFKLRALTLVFEGTAVFPSSLTCISSGWSGGPTEWSRIINDTYYNDNFISIKNNDDRKFKGTFIATIDQSTNLRELYRTVRGTSFILDAIDIGVAEPFGVDKVASTYEVVITDLEFDFFSPLHRQVTVEFTLVSGLI